MLTGADSAPSSPALLGLKNVPPFHGMDGAEYTKNGFEYNFGMCGDGLPNQ